MPNGSVDVIETRWQIGLGFILVAGRMRCFLLSCYLISAILLPKAFFPSQCSFAHIMTTALEQRDAQLKLCGCLQYVIEIDRSSIAVSSDATPADVFNHIFKVLLRSFTTSSLDERPKRGRFVTCLSFQ